MGSTLLAMFVNLYNYVINNPISFRDPVGLQHRVVDRTKNEFYDPKTNTWATANPFQDQAHHEAIELGKKAYSEAVAAGKQLAEKIGEACCETLKIEKKGLAIGLEFISVNGGMGPFFSFSYEIDYFFDSCELAPFWTETNADLTDPSALPMGVGFWGGMSRTIARYRGQGKGSADKYPGIFKTVAGSYGVSGVVFWNQQWIGFGTSAFGCPGGGIGFAPLRGVTYHAAGAPYKLSACECAAMEQQLSRTGVYRSYSIMNDISETATKAYDALKKAFWDPAKGLLRTLGL